MRRTLHVAAWCLGVALWASAGFAQSRVVVRDFEGPRADKLRDALVASLAGQVEVVDAGNAGAAGDISTEEGRVAVARELGVSAFVEGRVSTGKNPTLTVTVYNGADGASLGATDFSGGANALPAKVKRNAWDALGPMLAQASVPAAVVVTEPGPAPEPEPTPEEQAEPEEEEEAPEPEGVLETFDFSMGLRLQTRDFSYKDAFPGLRDYQLGLSPNLYMEAHWYPGAYVTDGIGAWFGVELRAQFMVGVDSQNGAGETFSTTSNAFGAALRFRVPLGVHEIGVLAGYGTHSFQLDLSENGVDPGVPSVEYGFLRLGLDTRLEFGSVVRVQARGAFLPLLSLGEVGEGRWFPHAGGSGLEADLLLGFAVVEWLELEVGGGLSRYGLSFHPEPTDPGVTLDGRVAGGALDQYYSLRFGATIRM